MSSHGRAGRGNRPDGTRSKLEIVASGGAPAAADVAHSRPWSPPDEATWLGMLDLLETQSADLERLRSEMNVLKRGWASFENLFRTSPVPMMEQDYTEVEAWMRSLRESGVSHVREVLGEDIDSIRRAAAMVRVVAANPAAEVAVGLPLEDLIGPIDPGIVNDGSQPGWLNQFSAVWERRPLARASFQAATADGRTYDAESILSAPVVDGEPDFSRAVFSLIDVTSHREEERRMAAIVEAKNRFLASVSHEIRTPLTAVLGFTRLLEDTEVSTDDRQLMISSVAEHAQEMSNLVEDLLVAARADMSQLEMIDVEVDLLAELQATLRAGGSFTRDVNVIAKTAKRHAKADPTRVRQILRNLLTNAERYGGDEVTVSVSHSGPYVLVDVADNGQGLPGEYWERIFDPYESAHVADGQPGSVGIGLTISRQLAELMGGSLEYRYHEEKSVFRLKLRSADR